MKRTRDRRPAAPTAAPGDAAPENSRPRDAAPDNSAPGDAARADEVSTLRDEVSLRPVHASPATAKVLRPGDQATVSVTVAVPPAVAFDVFTQEIDLWWRHGPKYRCAGRSPGALCLEAGVGGRLFESFSNDAGTHVVEVGRVTAWEPPSRLVLKWRNMNFAPDETTEVEVLFEPTETGTKVTVQHRGWAALRPDHPARHGLQDAAFSRMIGLWWAELLTSLREFTASKS